jgi:hypothetical protein
MRAAIMAMQALRSSTLPPRRLVLGKSGIAEGDINLPLEQRAFLIGSRTNRSA